MAVRKTEQIPVAEIKLQYMNILTLVERLHRRLLDIIKDEFDRIGRSDVNSVQALILFNVGESELTAGELRSRGYYLGSNVSYNLRKLVESGFVRHQPSPTDKRSVRISLTDSGLEIARAVDELYNRHARSMLSEGSFSTEEFRAANTTLHRLERFWADQSFYRP